MPTTKADDERFERFSEAVSIFVASVMEMGGESVAVSVMVPGENPTAAAYMGGPSSTICAMILFFIEMLAPEDFQSVLRLMHTAPDFELHRKAAKKGMVN